jgi:transposase
MSKTESTRPVLKLSKKYWLPEFHQQNLTDYGAEIPERKPIFDTTGSENTFTDPRPSFIYSKHLASSVKRRVRKHPPFQEADSLSIKPQVEDIGNRTNNNFHMEYVVTPMSTITADVTHGDGELGIENDKRDWSAYNNAQKQEGELFDNLLKELAETIQEPEQRGSGRRKLPISDLIFCSVKKIYGQRSSRRSYSLYKDAEEIGQLAHAPHYNAISKFLLREDITPILRELVKQSALPLAGLEKDFAIDSSGFSCSSFGAYCGARHGNEKEHTFLKAHICSGVKTNIVTDVVITDGHGADVSQFKELVYGTAKGFDISEVSADKAYTSRENLQLVGDLGATPFIPFKKRSRARAGGSAMWHKMFYYFQLHREEFDEHYHKRSNVESTFGAIKAKFGERLKSRKEPAQTNELLCKILAYNITVLIHEIFESGIKV